MAAPSLAVQIPGVGTVTADNLNTYVQETPLATDLRAFTALSTMTAVVAGSAAVGDGGAGVFYYDPSSTAADDGATVIVPYGNVQGAWLRSGYLASQDPPPVLVTPVTGATVTIANATEREIVAPAGTLATLTVALPAAPANGQLVYVTFTQSITALTVSAPGGQTLSSSPTAVTAPQTITYQYVSSTNTYYRVA